MINELYEMFPNEIVFKILSFQPHQTADMIREYWSRRLHSIGMNHINTHIMMISLDMEDGEEDIGIPFGFYGWYMYNEVWRMNDNIVTESGRIGDWYN